jgi:hypothetical protein
MAEFDNDKSGRKNEIYSIPIRAGKRTYFFDIKATRSNEYYLTITESKRRFNNENGKFFYEKHKLFLYKEDFDKFANGLNDAVHFIKTGEKPVITEVSEDMNVSKDTLDSKVFTDENISLDVSFEDLETSED